MGMGNSNTPRRTRRSAPAKLKFQTQGGPIVITQSSVQFPNSKLGIAGAVNDVPLFGIAKVDVANPVLTWNNTESSVEFRGAVTFKALQGADGQLAKFDFTGGKYVRISRDGKVQVVGDITLNGPFNVMPDGSWNLNTLALQVDTEKGRYLGTANIKTPSSTLKAKVDYSKEAIELEVESDGQKDLDVLGMEFDITKLNFKTNRDVNAGETWDPEFTLQGSLKLPDGLLNGVKASVDGSHRFLVNHDGLSLNGGALSLEAGKTVNLLGILEIKLIAETKLDLNIKDKVAQLTGAFEIPSLGNARAVIVFPQLSAAVGFTVGGANVLTVEREKMTLTGARATLDTFDFRLSDQLNVSAERVTVDYKQGEGDKDEWMVHGILKLKLGLFEGGAAEVQGDFTGSKGIRLTKNGGAPKVEVIGEFKVNSVQIAPLWKIESGTVEIDNTKKITKSSLTIAIPGNLRLTGTFTFVEGALDKIHIEGASAGATPLGSTGFEIRKIVGDVINIRNLPELKFTGHLEAQAGLPISLPIPSYVPWIGSAAKPVQLVVDATITTEGLSLSGDLLVAGGVARGHGDLVANWNQEWRRQRDDRLHRERS